MQLIWQVTLLVTTASSPTKQGLHDRLANSALVRPTSAGNGWVNACLVIAVGSLMALVVLGVLAFLANADQIRSILSEVGESI